jgi:hypothetical protein
LEEWRSLVEQRLNEAMERGEFDNLPGAGKPMRLNENPNEPHEVQMANRLLKNNDLAPGWILDRQRLLDETRRMQDEVARKWQWYQLQLAGDDPEMQAVARYQWPLWLAEWEKKAADLNRRIRDLNLTLPIWRMELLRFDLGRELARLGAVGGSRRLGE